MDNALSIAAETSRSTRWQAPSIPKVCIPCPSRGVTVIHMDSIPSDNFRNIIFDKIATSITHVDEDDIILKSVNDSIVVNLGIYRPKVVWCIFTGIYSNPYPTINGSYEISVNLHIIFGSCIIVAEVCPCGIFPEVINPRAILVRISRVR
jgi:hypothetical protein